MTAFLDNEEESDSSEDEVSKLNSGSDYHSDEEPYHWDSAPSNTSLNTEPKSLACTSTRSLKVNTKLFYYYNCYVICTFYS